MVYVRQIWADEDPDRPVSAARMNYIEEGLEAVAGEVASIGTPDVDASADSIPKRSAAGTVKTAAPVDDDDAVSLGSLNERLAWIAVDDFGQPGDLSDRDRVQRAITFAAENGIREVRLTKSSYTFRRGVNFANVHNVTVRGLGQGLTVIDVPESETGTTVPSAFFASGPCSNIRIGGMTVRGTCIDDVTAPRRSRTYSGPGLAQAFTFRGDLTPTAAGATPNPAHPRIEDVELFDFRVDATSSLPFLLSGVRGRAVARDFITYNTMDAGWIFNDLAIALNGESYISHDNGFSLSRGNRSVMAHNLYAYMPARAAVWVAGFLTTDGPATPGPENFNISQISWEDAGMCGLYMDDAPRRGKVSGIYGRGVRRGAVDEPMANAGVGIRIGGYPSDNPSATTVPAQDVVVSDFVLIDCAKGGVQVAGAVDISVRDGLIINPGSAFDYDGVTPISDTSGSQNTGVFTRSGFASTVIRPKVDNVKVVDNRSTPYANYSIFLDGAIDAAWSNVTSSGTRRTTVVEAVVGPTSRRGTSIFTQVVQMLSGAIVGSNAGTGTLRGLTVNGAAGSRRQLALAQTAGVDRWEIATTGDAETGTGHAGSDLEIVAKSDAGATLSTPMRIRRSDGRVTFGAVRLPSAPTAARPSASTLGVGAVVFDTTLNKPLWSDGANWRDATGTTV